MLWAPYGLGRSTMLQAVQKERGGIVLDMASYLERLTEAEPLALEETLHQMLIGALRENDVVLVDDLHLLNSVVCCNSFYPKKDFLNAPLEVAAAFARDKGRKLVFTMPSGMPQPIAGRAHFQGYKRLEPADFRFFFDLFLESAEALDVAKIHRFAPKLNVHQIRLACVELRRRGGTRPLHDRLSPNLPDDSNVDVGEVQDVDLRAARRRRHRRGARGERRAAAGGRRAGRGTGPEAQARRPARGPARNRQDDGRPGPGAPAARQVLPDRRHLHLGHAPLLRRRSTQVFEAAKQNAPSIIFIDDSDVIFESGEELGLYRYLLTMLDGLESESAGRVCVMMTAMDVGQPAAGAGPLGPGRAVAGDAPAGSRGPPGDPART